MLRIILAAGTALAAITAAVPVGAQDTAPPALSAPEIEFTEWTLANGLRVIALPDNRTADVTTSLWYEVGGKHDPEGRSGFAHLFEHILSRKTQNMPYNMINRLTEDVGGNRNASTGSDRTNYYETVPAEYLETMLWTHAERMARPVVDTDVFEKERAVVKEELRQRVLAPPYGRLSAFVISENAYDKLPLRRPIIGKIEDLDSATLDDARAFHQAYYGPDTATLIVAGNFDVARLRTMVDSYFAAIPRRANPVPLEISIEEPQRTSPRTVKATAPNVPLPVTGRLWQAPPALHPDTPALTVMDAIMSSGANSRLHEALVRTGKAVDAVQFLSVNEDGSAIAAFAILSPQADLAEVDAIMTAEVARMRETPVTQAELAEAKNTLFSDALSTRETARGRAFELGEALVSTGDPKAADKRLAAIATVTIEDVQRVARKYLAPAGAVTFTYTAGPDDPASYANPVPMPTFATVPPATGVPAEVKPEGERQAPPAAIEAPAISSARIERSTLSNGIALVASQTSDVPIATITMVVPGGDASDPAGKPGIASLAAAIADKGTPTRDATAIAAALESLGASMSASALPDGTFISLTAPTVNLAAAGQVLVDVVRNASYPEQEFAIERARVLDGLKATMSDPGSIASLVATRVLYGDAAYGQVLNASSVPAITRQDLIDHRTRYWHPAAAKLVISGGIPTGEAQAVAEQLFGGWTSSAPAPQRIADPAGTQAKARTVVIDMPDAGQAAVAVGARTLERGNDDFYKLWLANTVLGSGTNGWLFDEVRTKRSLSYGAGSGLAQRSGVAPLIASSQTKNDTADEVAQVILSQFARLGTETVPEDALEKRRLYLGGNVVRSLETSGGFNGQVASLMLGGIDPVEAMQTAERLSRVTPADAAAVAQTYLAPDKLSLVVVGDADQFIEELRALRGEVEVIPVTELDLAQASLRRPAQ